MQLLLTVPDSAAPGLFEHLRALGASWAFVVPEPPAKTAKPAKRPTSPRRVADDLRETIAEIKAARNGGPPLLTVEELFASLKDDEETDAPARASRAARG